MASRINIYSYFSHIRINYSGYLKTILDIHKYLCMYFGLSKIVDIKKQFQISEMNIYRVFRIVILDVQNSNPEFF